MFSFIFKFWNVLKGNMRDQEMCFGKSKNNHVEKVRIVKRIVQRRSGIEKVRATKQKFFYQEQQKAARNVLLQQTKVLHNAKQFVLNRKVAQSICTTISSKIIMFPRPLASVKMVMQKVISNPLVVSNAFKLFKF